MNIGPVLALIGAAGFVIAFALQNSLGNFASGILIMVFKPFDLGDLVEIGGVLGVVKSMNLLSVQLHTPDNRAVTIPNNNVWGEGRLDIFEAMNLPIFADGFESGDTSAWSFAVP